MPLNYGAGENSWESFGQQGDQTSRSKVNQPSRSKWNQPIILIGSTDAEVETPVFWSS